MKIDTLIALALTLFLLLPAVSFAQKSESVTFNIETLSKPNKSIKEIDVGSIINRLISSRVNHSEYIIPHKAEVLAHSDMPKSMVNYGYNSFFFGMYSAYANHHPFTISPDMVWLLITQGFANHVRANAEELRDKFVEFDEKFNIVLSAGSSYNSINWSEYTANFSEVVSKYTKGDIVEILTNNFSTTTPAERIASQATILYTFEKFFDYTIIRTICGIPKITLLGSYEDWQKVIEKTKALSKYNLEWWTDEIIPILEEIAECTKKKRLDSKGREFWRNMFKRHTHKSYGNPKVIDGWIVKFYPYSQMGRRMNLKSLSTIFWEKELKNSTSFNTSESYASLPDEIVKVPIRFIDERDNKSYDIELCAGFIGLEQDKTDHRLTPKIGWYVHKVTEADEIITKKHYDNVYYRLDYQQAIPETIYKIESINTLRLDCITFGFALGSDNDSENSNVLSIIPKKLSKIKIKELYINREISRLDKNSMYNLSEEEIAEWCKRYIPNTKVYVKDKVVYEPSLR